jgi:hypothetical protein
MKKTRIFWNRDEIGRFACTGKRPTDLNWFQRKVRSIKRWFRELFKRVIFLFKIALLGTTVVCFLAGIYKAGYVTGKSTVPETVFAREEVPVEVEVEKELPLMEKIMDCESGKRDAKTGRAIKGTATHYEKDGKTVLTRQNSDGTWDIGIAQINSVHMGEAIRLGYNLADEKENIAFAYHLLNEQGSQPWDSSKSCWKY